MTRRVNVLSLITTALVIVSFLFLMGCVAAKQKFQDDMMAKGVAPLTASEIKEVFSDATMHHKTAKQEFEGYYSADGKIQGHAKWNGGEGREEGAWAVADDGIYCDQFSGAWSKSGKRCYSVYPGNGEYEYTLVKVSGSHSKQYPDGIVPLKMTPGKHLNME